MRTCAWLAGLAICSTSLAATITVPGDFPTISAAITAAANGDTIDVTNSATYTESININKPLILISSGGATITFNTAANPVVKITSDAVVLGGGPGQGFIIDQQQAGDEAILIQGDKVKNSGVTIQNNTIKGNSGPYGIYVNPNIEGGILTIVSNNFQKRAAGYAFTDAIYFEYVAYGAPLNEDIAAHTATISINGNTGTDIDGEAVYFYGNVHNSDVTFNSNSFTGTAASFTGLYVDDSLHNFSTLTCNSNTLNNFDYGYYVSSYIENQSSMTISGGAVNEFRTYGLYID